ncbi:MAG: hypothetical protein F6K41_17280 [Symploca sp. SIO3E6]|nr:hypothetical protein [Caldora sp. SIO3E6]
MDILAAGLAMIGTILAVVGYIWLLVAAFQKSLLWGFGSLFVPCVSWIFVITHWNKASEPFLVQIIGSVLLVIGLLMSG